MTYDIVSTRRVRKTIKVTQPDDLFGFIKKYAKSRQEQFLVITLDGAHQVISIHLSTIGILNSVMIHPREVFIHAIRDNAKAVMVAHNHPSGALTPSPEDKEMTERLTEAAKILGFHFLDHLIFNRYGFYSFRKEGDMAE